MIDFATIYERHANDVFRFALYLTGNRAVAEDVTAETFARAWGAVDRIRFQTVKAYLIAIARNLSLNARSEMKNSGELSESVPDDRSDSARTTENKLELDRVISDLRTLSDIDRAALLMRAEEELSYEEIAVALGITVTAAKVKVHRARRRLLALRELRRRTT